MELGAPAMVTWQLTRDCNLACLHCCTDSAPGKALPHELSREEALRIADEIIAADVPKVMIVGGEPTIVPHFFEVAEKLGRAGVLLKIETNGQDFGPADAARLKGLPIFSIQISLDGDTEAVYAKQRPGGKLSLAHRACQAVVETGLPLEITYAPTRINIEEAGAVLRRAASFGAFRFNTGMLMRVGTAAKLWDRIEPSREQYAKFLRMLRHAEKQPHGTMELCFRPWSLARELTASIGRPSSTLLVLPDGKVKVSAALPYLCADLRRQPLRDAWRAYQGAWKNRRISSEILRIAREPERTADANKWVWLDPEESLAAPDMPGHMVNPDRLTAEV